MCVGDEIISVENENMCVGDENFSVGDELISVGDEIISVGDEIMGLGWFVGGRRLLFLCQELMQGRRGKEKGRLGLWGRLREVED